MRFIWCVYPCIGLILLCIMGQLACSEGDNSDTLNDTDSDLDTDSDTDTDTDSDSDSDTDSDTDSDSGTVPDNDTETGTEPPFDECEDAETGVLQIVDTTYNSPYAVRHPSKPDDNTATIIFLPGGPGNESVLMAIYNFWLAEGVGIDDFRVVIPYTLDASLADESERVLHIVEEVLYCYGGDPDAVHLGGTSNGGVMAYALMLEEPDCFVTLLGAPGVFQGASQADMKNALASKSVFSGVGELDDGWYSNVQSQHETMVALGIDSTFVEFPGQGHILDASFDETVFFDFWASH